MLRYAVAAAIALTVTPAAQTIDWKSVDAEARQTLQGYVRINTSNPPGDVTKAADYLSGILKNEGISVTRYESGPGRSILLARLKGDGTGGKAVLLESHMDVVPTDPSRWAHDPFGAEIADGRMWGRGTIDMKGIGVSYLYAFIMLHRQHAALTRDVLLLLVPDEEIGGAGGAEWMRKNHYAELDPEFVIDEGGFGSRDMFTPGKLVFGISVAEKRIMWLKLRAEGVAGHGSQPIAENANEHLMRALTRLLGSPIAATPFPVVETMKQRIGAPLTQNKFMNAIQQSTISLTSLRSGVGDPPRVNVIPSIAEATIDCRVLPGTSPADWLKLIESRLAEDRGHQSGRGSGRLAAGHEAVRRVRTHGEAPLPGCDRHPDDGAVRHRRQRLPRPWRQELRIFPRHRAGGVAHVHARRLGVHSARRDRPGNPDHVRGAGGDGYGRKNTQSLNAGVSSRT
jgi:acetylornithine deacetylase/succinyl-diaminopimelate desuccinylase-like protein